eukprot:2230122-Rhodomonas_salina.1
MSVFRVKFICFRYWLFRCPCEVVSSVDGLGSLVLQARCPTGTSLNNDECLRCRSAMEYVINPNLDQCQPCPPGLVCIPVSPDSPFQVLEEEDLAPIQDGSLAAPENVRPCFNESKWRIDNDIWILDSCPLGYYVSNVSGLGHPMFSFCADTVLTFVRRGTGKYRNSGLCPLWDGRTLPGKRLCSLYPVSRRELQGDGR